MREKGRGREVRGGEGKKEGRGGEGRGEGKEEDKGEKEGEERKRERRSNKKVNEGKFQKTCIRYRNTHLVEPE